MCPFPSGTAPPTAGFLGEVEPGQEEVGPEEEEGELGPEEEKGMEL